MSWRDEYRPGAFRGVPFHLKTSTATGGRRTVLNEYPLRDEPSTEDMGRRARQYQLTMSLIGPDYMARRDRLIDALEAPGPGTLIHPFRGELHVALLGDYSCEESTEHGGLARISVTFVEAGAMPAPSNVRSQGSEGIAAADALQADALTEFEDDFSIVGYASFVADAAADAVEGATEAIREAGGLSQLAGDFGRAYRRLHSGLQQLLLAPGNLAAELIGMVRSLGSLSDPLEALKAQMALFGLGDKAKSAAGSGYQSGARVQVARNQLAVHRLIERAALAEAVRLSVIKPGATPAGVAWDSRDQAAQVRDQLLDEIDRQQLQAAAEHYRPLARLAAALVSEMNTHAANLRPLTRITPPATVPALLLAHRLYGDARRADEIVIRNRLTHPGFVPGGRALEVLRD